MGEDTSTGPAVETSGFVGCLTPTEQTALTEIRKKMGDKISHPRFDDPCVLRFLRARKFDVEKTALMIDKYLQWRNDFKVDSVIETEFPEMQAIKSYYPHGYHGVDRLGRPVYIECLGKVDASKLLAETTIERFLEYYVKEYEMLLEVRFTTCSVASGNPVEQSLTILNLEGIGMRHFGKETRTVIQRLTQICQDYYPETLGRMFVINTPAFFSMIWSFVKPLLDEKTRSKISVHRSLDSCKEELFKLVSPDQLPEFLGGTCKYTPQEKWATAELGPWSHSGTLVAARKLRPFSPLCLYPKSVHDQIKDTETTTTS